MLLLLVLLMSPSRGCKIGELTELVILNICVLDTDRRRIRYGDRI